MTHDELLAEVNKNANWDDGDNSNALRAVVELHKPETVGDGRTYIPAVVFKKRCEYCSGIYPCGTIRVIEKELA